MVTTINFFSSVATMWAFVNIMGCQVLLKLKVTDSTAWNTWMTDSTAFEAHFLATLACCSTRVKATTRFFSSYKANATILWTPFQVWVCFNINVFLEFQVLLVNIIAPKLFHIFLGVFFFATMLHAPDFVDLAISNLWLEVVWHAVPAIFVVLACFQTIHTLI